MSKRVSPDEAKDLMEREGYVYVDVRSVPEFQTGHPAGSYNVPLVHMGGMGSAPNHEFLGVMEKAFPKDARIVVGCKSGGRSAQAAAMLEAAGFTHVVDQWAGFDGGLNPATRRPEPGWRPRGLPSSQEAAPDHTWDGLRSR